MRLIKIIKYVNIILFCSFVICELLNFLFQGVIRSVYELKASSGDYVNDYNAIGMKYKNIGVEFSNIADILFYAFLTTFAIWLIFNIVLRIKKKRIDTSNE